MRVTIILCRRLVLLLGNSSYFHDTIGGTLVYANDISKDKYGNDVHSSVFEGTENKCPQRNHRRRCHPDFPYANDVKPFIFLKKGSQPDMFKLVC